jgi:AraC-like DNA-binding protein
VIVFLKIAIKVQFVPTLVTISPYIPFKFFLSSVPGLIVETSHNVMTYYQEQIARISKELYSKDYLTKQVVKAKLFIDKQYANNISLKEIAGEAFFSKFHFIRIFKTLYGITPYQHLKGVRIEKAKRLLRAGRPVSEVGFSVGFESSSSFTGFFKKITGSTPSEFKKNKSLANRRAAAETVWPILQP